MALSIHNHSKDAQDAIGHCGLAFGQHWPSSYSHTGTLPTQPRLLGLLRSVTPSQLPEGPVLPGHLRPVFVV